MDLHLAGIIAHATREQAVHDARTDLHRLQQQAIEAGREESRRLIKVSHIDHTTGQATYRPAGRLLRDWYLHCYTNAVRNRLGSPAVAIDAQQVEDTTALLHRLTPNRSAVAALRAVAVLRDLADADAAHATVSIATTLHATAAHRAIAHAPDSRFDADPLRIHVTRHWYLHSYLDHLHTATRSQPAPIATDTVERDVALSLTTRTIHPLVSDAAMTLTTRGGRHPDREHADPDPADDPRLPIKEAPPEEAARIMFRHPNQMHGPVGQATEETSTSTSRLSGLNEPVADSESTGRSLHPRIA
jgi:hypothetical protein